MSRNKVMVATKMRKLDRLEQRARELSLAAGVDPDSRVDRPGQRSMPAWCAYRDAARAEQVARRFAQQRLDELLTFLQRIM